MVITKNTEGRRSSARAAPRKKNRAGRLGKYVLKLYVAGQTPKSVRAFRNLTVLCETHLEGNYDLQVVDLLKEPRLARTDQIIAIPTLIKSLPLPEARIIGDLTDQSRVLAGLQVIAAD